MVGAEQLSERVVRVLAPNPSMMTLDGTNTYLVGSEMLAVIDPGPDIPEHLDAIVAASEARGTLAVSLVTHRHDDHLPAARRLRDRLGVPIAGHPDLPGVDRPLGDEQRTDLPDATLVALHTQGHTADHVCYLLEQEAGLFSGDLIAGAGTVVVGDGRADLAHYLDSLDRVERAGARTIYPGHGPVVDDPAAKMREYRDHRLGRERQILDELARGERSIAEIVARLYAAVSVDLHPMAARNVRSHLWKLEAERRVEAVGERWRALNAGATP